MCVNMSKQTKMCPTRLFITDGALEKVEEESMATCRVRLNFDDSVVTQSDESFCSDTSSGGEQKRRPTPLAVMSSPRVCRPACVAARFCNGAALPTAAETPPYKRVRALRLFDSPQTPMTLLQCAESADTPMRPARRGGDYNTNPFTPDAVLLHSGIKRRRDKSRCNNSNYADLKEDMLRYIDDDEVEKPTKKIALRKSNIPRYNQEFLEICPIGTGEFGTVYKCVNRLDGCVYALKKSRRPIASIIDEQNAMNEVYAHAVLGKHPHVVRYYSAWAEDNHMLIQNEYCNGGSLVDVMNENASCGRHFSEQELKQILLHVAEGLKYIHSMHLVHMDIKPGNIFVSRNSHLADYGGGGDLVNDGFDNEHFEQEDVIYKIGDFGHVTLTTNPQVEEGDCRYLPTEILRDDYSHLSKADIFALGLTTFEAGGGGELPKNGDAWHEIRNGNLPFLDQYSQEFNKLLKEMIHTDPEKRPSAAALLQHHVLCPFANKSRAQLRRELNAEKLKNGHLLKRLEEAAMCLKGRPVSKKPGQSSARIVGKKVNRSLSVTNF